MNATKKTSTGAGVLSVMFFNSHKYDNVCAQITSMKCCQIVGAKLSSIHAL